MRIRLAAVSVSREFSVISVAANRSWWLALVAGWLCLLLVAAGCNGEQHEATTSHQHDHPATSAFDWKVAEPFSIWACLTFR